MNAPLYTIEILRLASSLGEPRVLERPDGEASERSPACGSVVSAAVQLAADGRVQAFSQTVQACAFGQASAAILERHAVGCSLADVDEAFDALRGWLGGDGDQLPDWPEMEALAPARTRRSRHAAILLPFRALISAMKAAER